MILFSCNCPDLVALHQPTTHHATNTTLWKWCNLPPNAQWMHSNPRKLKSVGQNKMYYVSGIRIATWNGSPSFWKKSKILGKVPGRNGCASAQRKIQRTFSACQTGTCLCWKLLSRWNTWVEGCALHNLLAHRCQWIDCLSGLGSSEHRWEGHIWGL